MLKAVILTAGLGTRLLPATKETPKVLLPIFALGKNGKPCLKPVLQLVFEQLYDVGFREFCFVVGTRSRRSVEKHFTPDRDFIRYLKEVNKPEQADELQQFYRKVKDSTLVFTNQPEPRGTGDAIRRVKDFTGKESFLLHMGDDLVLSKKENSHLKRLIRIFKKRKADAAFLAKRVKDPTMYGVIAGKQIVKGLHEVKTIVYRPKVPPSNLSDVTAYLLKSNIYPEIGKVEPDKESGEVSLIPAIQSLIDGGGRVYAVELRRGERRIDIGNAKLYWQALDATYKLCGGRKSSLTNA
ncbi:NTP transferase domain-containing protein [Candidatus Bathyarchaeota archaeon]|nr:NTP transferase domain-containing protein [Candidatus Bathyarchaeota archaeon]